MSFVHLHVHSEYSILKSTSRLSSLLEKVKQSNQSAIALCDIGNMFGIINFFSEAEKLGVKSIIGCDFFILPQKLEKNESISIDKVPRLILLVENKKGYQNLINLSSKTFINDFLNYPYLTWDLLKENTEGLIAILPNIQSELGHAILRGDKTENILEFYQRTFFSFYLGVSSHGLENEDKCNQSFLKYSQEQNLELVAIHENFYTNPEDFEAYEVFSCIASRQTLHDYHQDQLQANKENYYVPSTEEMVKLLCHFPRAIENTQKIADRCNFDFELNQHNYWPHFKIPEGFKSDYDYLKEISYKGIKKRYSEITLEIKERLEYELTVMKGMNVVGYMLVVQDLINSAKEKDISVGPGRGSAVGSLVCYATGITDVDPLPLNLLFERFLNQERNSMPDIDIDFSDLDRSLVIDYVVEKYGKNCVTQVVTYGKMQAKQVLKDVGRALGFDFSYMNKEVISLFSKGSLTNNLQQEIDNSPQLKQELNKTKMHQKLLSIAIKLEGLIRQTGIHAAAVIITPDTVSKYAPVFRQEDSQQLIAQYDKNFLESIGLLKMDFLGLRNLSVIQKTVLDIEKQFDKKIDVLKLPVGDKAAFDMLSEGRTVGVFQFESEGMSEHLKHLKPDCFEDLVAMNALYRPGPMSNIPSFIARKKGLEGLNYYDERLKSILDETYGIIVYQEQVMKIAQVLSGFSLNKADDLRRVMAKKKHSAMIKLKPVFVEGAIKNNFTVELAEQIWDVLVPFSSYAFNKSHAAAYSLIAYQTAYLKANFPVQYMAMTLASEYQNTDSLVKLLKESQILNIKIEKPNINTSTEQFSSNHDTIIYGLSSIKNVGLGFSQRVVQNKNEKGSFKSLLDFCMRLSLEDINRRTIESLIYAGTFDELPNSRAQQFSMLEDIISLVIKEKKDKESGQISFFSFGEEASENKKMKTEIHFGVPNIEPWPYFEMLAKEREVLGMYVSGHPLETYELELRSFTTFSLDNIQSVDEGVNFIIGGILNSVNQFIGKKDNRAYSIAEIEDLRGKASILFPSDFYEQNSELIQIDQMVLLRCKMTRNPYSDRIKIAVERMTLLETALEILTKSVIIRLSHLEIKSEFTDELYKLISSRKGDLQCVINIYQGQELIKKIISDKIKFSLTPSLLKKLTKLVGFKNITLSKHKLY